MKLYAGTDKDRLAHSVANELGVDLCAFHTKIFNDGEMHVEVTTPVTDETVYVIHRYDQDPNQWYVQALLMADSLRRAGAKRLYLIAPYLVYARQDVPDGEQLSSYASPVICKGLSQAYDGLCIFDLHAPQTQGFFQVPVANLSADGVIATHLKQHNYTGATLVSPDFGGSKRVQRIHTQLDMPMAIIEKSRESGLESLGILGDVVGRDCVIIDDVMVSGVSLQQAGQLLINHGAKSVRAYVTHMLFEGDLADWLQSAKIDYLYVTDTTVERVSDDHVMSVAPQVADYIKQQQGGNNDS